MECNRDEAIRSKEIAEKKFLSKDITGAKKFAIKAQNLYPGLEGISQMLATLDVYISAEKKINGEVDWYGILGVNPLADEETVRKHYRKLALMLHPDKNKSIGAEGAFKFISEAWSLLSDKAKRLTYDKKWSRLCQQRVQPKTGASASPVQNGIYNFSKKRTSHVRVPKAGANSCPASSSKQECTTFWTVCHQCKIQYEYVRIYLNRKLLCPNCHKPFFALETPPPSNGTKVNLSNQKNNSQHQQNATHQGVSRSMSNAGRNNSTTANVASTGFNDLDSSNHVDFQWNPFYRTSGTFSATQAASMVKQAYEKVKREREEAKAKTKRKATVQRKNTASKRTGGALSSVNSDTVKRRRVTEHQRANNKGKDSVNHIGVGTVVVGKTSASGLQLDLEQNRASGASKHSRTKNALNTDIKCLLMEMARMEIHRKLNEWKSDSTPASRIEVDGNVKAQEEEQDNSVANGDRQDENKCGEPFDTRNESSARKSVADMSDDNPNREPMESVSIDVPDPDFYDFDGDRTERCFEENQVWAAYDDDDGMPRYYVMIRNVISLDPFKVKIGWLNSKTNSEIGPLNWVSSGFSRTCGDFRTGKHKIINSLNSFSHKIRWIKGMHGHVRIFPKKGEVWALYRNWSPEWNELTADEIIHKYDMVEVVQGYDEETGVIVVPLVKVAGFKSLFHHHLNPSELLTIQREEMFRFSHHVPSYLLTGQEATNAPKGCRELDPAAIPLELLQVIMDVDKASAD